MDFDTFTKRVLPSDEQWVVYDEHGNQFIDDEMYEQARKKYKDYLRDGKLKEPTPEPVSEPEKEPEDEPKGKSEVVHEPEQKVSDVAEPKTDEGKEIERIGMSHGEKMMYL